MKVKILLIYPLIIGLLHGLAVQSSMAATSSWNWDFGICGVSGGGILNDQIIDIEPNTEVCVLPPSYEMSFGPRLYVGVWIGGTYFPETTVGNERCMTVSGSPVSIRSSTYCTVEGGRLPGTIRYTSPPLLDCRCSSCAECMTELNRPECSIVYLDADISNQAGPCINNPTGFTDKTLDCQGHTIDGNDSDESHPDYGIFLSGKSGNTIKNCTISDFRMGIGLWTSSNSNTLVNNTVTSNKLGIDVSSSHSNVIRDNDVSDNRYYYAGFYRGDGLRLILGSSGNTVMNNTVASNPQYGIRLDEATSNTVSGNTVTLSSDGIRLENAENNTVTNNVSSENQANGLTIYWGGNNSIYSNTFCDNNQLGSSYYDVFSHSDYNPGDNNKCDTTSGWNDAGTTGCTYPCGVPDDADADTIPDAEDNCPYTPNPTQEDMDGDGLGDVCDAERDGDGIVNEIDGYMNGGFVGEGGSYSNNFTDEALGAGTTSGSIVDRDGMVVSVEEETNPSGVHVSAAGAGTATIHVCGFDLALTGGDSVITTCGSFDALVLAGPVEVQLDVGVLLTIPTGGHATVSETPEGGLTVVNTGHVPIIIEEEGGPVEVGPGEHYEATPVPPNCGNGTIQWKQGETCDPPGSICGSRGNPDWMCSEICQCEYVGRCGDGRVQWKLGEECELGVGNECGPYGECIDCVCVAD